MSDPTTVAGHQIHCYAAEGDPGEPLTVEAYTYDAATKTLTSLGMTPAAARLLAAQLLLAADDAERVAAEYAAVAEGARGPSAVHMGG